MKKSVKNTLVIILCLTFSLGAVVGISFGVLFGKTRSIDNDFSAVYENEKYSKAVSVENVKVVTQSVSCGYAVIEMFSASIGGDITEEKLFDEYGKVVTSTGAAFCNEFNKRFPEYKTTMYKYLKNTELMDKIYTSLENGVPVPFEWAALYGDEWTLHYSLVTGMDVKNDTVTVANPYGYIENLSIQAFLDRTSFRAFEHIPFFYRLAFAFGVFEKNTVFIPSKVD